MNFNKAFILGNVTRDPESRALPSGQQVVNFGIATNRFYTDQAGQKKQDTEFHNVVAFGKLADIAARYLTKGGLVMIEGRIKNSSWQGTDGVKKYKSEIIAETLQLGPRPMGQGGAPSGGSSYQKPQFAQQNQPATNIPKIEEIPIIEENAPVTNFVSQEEPGVGEGEIDVKDIPF